MQHIQSAIILPISAHGRYLTFDLIGETTPAKIRTALKKLAPHVDGKTILVGIGASLATALGQQIDGLREFPRELRLNDAPDASPAALWLWLRGDERGDLFNASMQLARELKNAFTLRHVVDGFSHHKNRDLTGFEDGTENPKGKAAIRTAFLGESADDGLSGSSFVAVQQWSHQWDKFNAMTKSAQDNAIGRERVSNDELENAPKTAHIKRTTQEDFSPEAFVMRRSMPWVEGQTSGLMFVAFGFSFDAFEAQWRRMLGLDDGIKDALFKFSQPMNHDYFWCPPMREGLLDLRVLGL